MSPRRSPASTSQSRPPSPYNVQSRQASVQPTPQAGKQKKREQFSACGACRMRRVRCDLKDLQQSSTGQLVSCSNCRERGLKCVDEFAEVKAVKLLRRGRRLQQAEAFYGKVPPEEAALRSVTPPANVIPRLAPEFFDSAFFWRLQIQRPILEITEFGHRYTQFARGNSDALQVPGQLLAMALVVWAASFGVNEYGVEEQELAANIRQRKEHVNDMLQELLYLIDLHGILRKASWDGVRLLLLLLPLSQELQSPTDRLVMYEATTSQVYNLCTLGTAASVGSGQGDYIDALVRARIFWYGYVLDGVTSALRGGRMLLSDDDLTAFEMTLPSRGNDSHGASLYELTFKYMDLPIRISALCRDIHAVLTGPKARQKEDVKEDRLQYIWQHLASCWKELDELRTLQIGDAIAREDTERFIHGWQIFIFECHNVIREALKQRLVSPVAYDYNETDSEPARRQERVIRLHDRARKDCQSVVRDVVTIIQNNLGTTFFQSDAGLVRDGCFYAAFLLASEGGSSTEVETCLRALDEMRWVYSKSEERMNTVRMVWQSRVQQTRGAPRAHSNSPMASGPSSLALMPNDTSRRPRAVPPLTIPTPSDDISRPSSAPTTGRTPDGSWPSVSGSEGQHHSYPSSAASLHDSPPVHPDAYPLNSPAVGMIPDEQIFNAPGGSGAKASRGVVPLVPELLRNDAHAGPSFNRQAPDSSLYWNHYNIPVQSSHHGTHQAGASSSSMAMPSYTPQLSYPLDVSGHAGPSILPQSSGPGAAPHEGHGHDFSTGHFYPSA